MQERTLSTTSTPCASDGRPGLIGATRPSRQKSTSHPLWRPSMAPCPDPHGTAQPSAQWRQGTGPAPPSRRRWELETHPSPPLTDRRRSCIPSSPRHDPGGHRGRSHAAAGHPTQRPRWTPATTSRRPPPTRSQIRVDLARLAPARLRPKWYLPRSPHRRPPPCSPVRHHLVPPSPNKERRGAPP